jgi:SAM-dependent methyltransferase
MTLSRILEAEWMDSPEEADAYDAMDHAEVNRQFVTDLLAAVPLLATREPEVTGEQRSADEAPDPGDSDWIDVLDLGTGTGQIPVELCRHHPRCRVLATDAAISMLELGRYRVEAAGMRERIVLSVADSKELPFESGQFPIVMSNSLVHHIPHPIDALREAIRVTAPGGWLFFRDLRRPESETEWEQLVETHAAGETELARRLFSDSLRAALTVAEMQALVGSLAFPLDTVQASSDRHWTWIARKPDIVS